MEDDGNVDDSSCIGEDVGDDVVVDVDHWSGQDEVEHLRTQIDAARYCIASLNTCLQEEKARAEYFKNMYEEADAQLEEASDVMDDLKTTSKKLRKTLSTFRKKFAELRKDLDELNKLHAEALAHASKSNEKNGTALQTLDPNQDPVQASR